MTGTQPPTGMDQHLQRLKDKYERKLAEEEKAKSKTSNTYKDPAIHKAHTALNKIVTAPRPPANLLNKLQAVMDMLEEPTLQVMGGGIIRRQVGPEYVPVYSLQLANPQLTETQYNEIANLMSLAGILPDQYRIELQRMKTFIAALFVYLSSDYEPPKTP